ncbi:MAG TPA: hypothetical protein VMT58_05930, partial [Candidatus Binataceae bacterium]|nr:hypothetical protein [Candidatus Binataceae bacterium]
LAARLSSLRTAIEAAPGSEQDRAAGAGMRLQTVLESLNGDRPKVDPSLLSQVIRTPHELEPAVRAVLGDQLEAVIVESPQFALRAIEVLKENHAGRLSFVQEPVGEIAPHGSIAAPGIAGRLVDMLGVEPRFAPVAEMMLGHVIVADNLRAAIAASNLNGHGTVFVTREGDLVWPDRVISGGSAEEARAASLPGSIGDAARELARAEMDERVRTEELALVRGERERAEAEIDRTRARAHEAERIVNECRAALARTEQSAALADSHAAGTRRRVGEIADSMAASNARLEELAVAERSSRGRLAEINAEIGARRAAAEEAGAALMEAAARAEARRSRLEALENELAHAIRESANLESQIVEHCSGLERAGIDRAEFERELQTLATQDAAAGEREAALDAELARLTEECGNIESALDARRTDYNASNDALAASEGAVTECGLKRERARTLCEELDRGFAEKFGAVFDSLAEEIVPALGGRDSSADDARIAELRAKMERIGEVNLAAESEVKELEERGALLGGERADLQSALDELTRTIAHLNREARRRFAETFEGAAKNFSELFPKLLRGGKGRLELTEGGDVLEAGVNILVQPAGKKVKEIGLLSGGEKALSAMALIFSLFLLNPCPFCVMDEVDAPLDEFSLAAFTTLLGELKARSQFIVITHNQRTMQRADQIHGVTMDRPGVSRIISLRIPQAA